MNIKPSAKTKIYFSNLDGMRFLCFFAVFCFHSIYSENDKIYSSGFFTFFKERFFANGYLGVNFFFVLSGFLITYLLIKEKLLNGRINVPNFWIRRILRIWPLYIVCVGIGFFIFPLMKTMMGDTGNETADFWYYIFFAANFDYIHKGMPDAPGLSVLWSIAVEEQFYLVWPLILSILPVKKYWMAFAVILAGSWVFRAVVNSPVPNAHFKPHEMHTFSCIGDMAIGALGAWLSIMSAKCFAFFKQMPRLIIILAYLTLFLFLFFRQDIFIVNPYIRIFERSILAFAILFIILEQCFAETSFFKMSSFTSLTKLGVVTYGLYCIHFIIISIVTALSKKWGLDAQLWQVLILQPVISLAITIGLSLLSYKYFELPFLRLKNRFAYFVKE